MSNLTEVYEPFLKVAGLLIPEGPGTASAAEVLRHRPLVARALTARPDLEQLVVTAVTLGADADTLDQLERAVGFPSEAFNALTLIVAGAYYLSTAVLETLDYDPPAERYVNGSLEHDIVNMLPRVKCTPRFAPEHRQ